MLKVTPRTNNIIDHFKCGEVFCISSDDFNITCCLCADKIPFDEFPSHFQLQHLALVEESIYLEELESEEFTETIEDVTILDNATFKEDPIKHKYKAADSIDNDDILQVKQKKFECLEQCFLIEEKIDYLNVDNKSIEESSIKSTKKGGISRKNTNYVKEIQGSDIEISVALDDNAHKESEELINGDEFLNDIESEEHINEDEFLNDLESEELISEYEFLNDNDGDMDANWTQKDNKKESQSKDKNKDNFKVEPTEPCPICGRLFRNNYGVLIHTQMVHNPKKPGPPKESKYKCAECKQCFRNPRDLNRHKWTHTGIFCDVCGREFSEPSNLFQHKQRHTGIKDFKCEECGKAFFTDRELKSHIITHTGKMQCICEICGKQCRQRTALRAHMRRHTGERPAKCNVCGKCFFSFNDLNIHAVSHTSERPFKCNICGSAFQRRTTLRVHKLTHSKDRKHVCTICGKGFAQSGGLKSHMRSHDTTAFEPPQLTLINPAVRGLDLPTITIIGEASMSSNSSELEEFMD